MYIKVVVFMRWMDFYLHQELMLQHLHVPVLPVEDVSVHLPLDPQTFVNEHDHRAGGPFSSHSFRWSAGLQKINVLR